MADNGGPSTSTLSTTPISPTITSTASLTSTSTSTSNETEEQQHEKFISELDKFMKLRGTPIPPTPTIGRGGKSFDLWSLYKHVTDRGGLENVLKEKLWGSIVPLIEMPHDCTNPAYTLRVLYLKFLYAYERRHFLYIDDDEANIDYSPKLPQSSANSSKPSVGMHRPMFKAEYRRTPMPIDSSRLKGKIKDSLQLQKICFALRSRSSTAVQWGLELLALRSYQGEVLLRGVTEKAGANGEDGVSFNVGNSLLSALAELAKSYYSPPPALAWKSEKAPDSPNETHILTILRNLTLVPQNDAEMAAHPGIVEFLTLSLSHPTPTCVEDALETLAALSLHLNIGWEGEGNGETLIQKVATLLCDGFSSALKILANITSNVNNWPYVEPILLSVAQFFDRLDGLLNSNEEDISSNALKIVVEITKYGTETKTAVAGTPGVMQYLIRHITAASSRSDEEDIEETTMGVLDALYNLASDPATHSSVLLYEPELLQVILMENTANPDLVTTILSTLATP